MKVSSISKNKNNEQRIMIVVLKNDCPICITTVMLCLRRTLHRSVALLRTWQATNCVQRFTNAYSLAKNLYYLSCHNAMWLLLMRPFTIILFFLLFNFFCFGQTKEQKFKSTVEQIVAGFSKQDSAKVSQYINKEIGLYQLVTIGVFEQYHHFKSISFSNSIYSQVLFSQSKNIKLLPLRYSTLPTFSCDKERWSKKGLFVDTTRTDHLLSKICNQRNKNVADSIPEKTIRFFYDLENKSRRVVLNDNNGIELVFYLSYINNKWFLTIIDNVSSDCSV
jgi:hypothetical protein